MQRRQFNQLISQSVFSLVLGQAIGHKCKDPNCLRCGQYESASQSSTADS